MNPSDAAIVLCADKNWAPYARFLISQIDSRNPSKLDIWFCATDDLSSQLPDHVNFLKVDTPSYFDNLPQSYRISLASYLRLFLPAAFKGRYNRLLYLDCDMFLEGGDLARLGSVQLPKEHPLAAVRTSHQWFEPLKQMKEFKLLGLEAKPYFNAGMLLIDLNNWFDLDCDAQVEETLLQDQAVLTSHDQSVLNLVAKDRWSELSPVWNWMYSGKTNYFIAQSRPNVIHFAGRMKPWSTNDGRVPPYYFNSYQEFFEGQSDLQYLAQPPIQSFAGSAKFHRKSLFQHLLRTSRMKSYLNRFKSDYDVLDPIAV